MAEKPTTRTGATKPDETKHLDEGQKQALDEQELVEHTDGKQRERHARKAAEKAG